jgi:hypothetical protein
METGAQRRLLNKLVQTIASHTGHEFSEIKTYAKRRAIRRGYPIMDDGGPVYDDDGEVIGESETRITGEQASILIEELYQLAAEVGALYQE